MGATIREGGMGSWSECEMRPSRGCRLAGQEPQTGVTRSKIATAHPARPYQHDQQQAQQPPHLHVLLERLHLEPGAV